MNFNDNIFAIREAGKNQKGNALELDVQRVQFNNWQRDLLQELMGVNSNLKSIKKRIEYALILIVLCAAFTFINPWL